MDLATISDQEVRSDDIVYMVFQKEVGGGWEELQVDMLSTNGGEVLDVGGGGTSQMSGNVP